jgi:hypothetical protein
MQKPRATGPTNHALSAERSELTDALPLLMRLPAAGRWSGCSRSRLYQLAGSGDVIFRKLGSATLVDVASLRNYLTSLPVATIKQPNTTSKAA